MRAGSSTHSASNNPVPCSPRIMPPRSRCGRNTGRAPFYFLLTPADAAPDAPVDRIAADPAVEIEIGLDLAGIVDNHEVDVVTGQFCVPQARNLFVVPRGTVN